QCRGTAVGGKSQGKAALFLCSAENAELWRYDSTGLKRKQLAAAGRLLSVGQGAFLLEGACEAQFSDSRGAKGAVSSPAGSDVCWLREQEARTLKLPAAAQGPSRGERAFVVDAS